MVPSELGSIVLNKFLIASQEQVLQADISVPIYFQHLSGLSFLFTFVSCDGLFSIF